MGTCSSRDYLDAHRRCGLRSSALRCIGVSLLAEARRHYGRQASAIWPSHIGSLPGPHRELVSCISCDNLDAHRRCGLRSSASRYIVSAHYRQGSAALWALGIGPMAEAYWQSARASSASVATANLGCPSALRPTLIGMKVHLFCALSPRLGGIMGARHRPYGRSILAVCPSLIANWYLYFF